MSNTEDLIFFEEEEYTNTKRISMLEHTVETLMENLSNLHSEISILRQELYNYVSTKRDCDTHARFTIHRIPKDTASDSSSSEAILIDV
jgi:predicted RNase H-like nuclease (RuvC/YqgF family)